MWIYELRTPSQGPGGQRGPAPPGHIRSTFSTVATVRGVVIDSLDSEPGLCIKEPEPELCVLWFRPQAVAVRGG